MMLDAIERGLHLKRDGTIIGLSGRPISGYRMRGYIRFDLKTSRKDPSGRKTARVYAHRVQAFQKFGHQIFDHGIQVRHLNGDPSDNSWGNIAIGTQSDNMMDRPAAKRKAIAKKAAEVLRKLTNEGAAELRILHRQGWTYRELMARFKIAKSTVSYIVNGRTYS